MNKSINISFIPSSIAELKEVLALLGSVPATVTVQPATASSVPPAVSAPYAQPLQARGQVRVAGKVKHPLEQLYNTLYGCKFTVSADDCDAVGYKGERGAVDVTTRLSMIATRLCAGGLSKAGAEVPPMSAAEVQAIYTNAPKQEYAGADDDSAPNEPTAPPVADASEIDDDEL